MNIAVIGAGYVGLVTAAGLSSLGHRVRVGEANLERVRSLNAGEIPLHEANLDPLVADGRTRGLLTFHTDNTDAVAGAEIVLLALPTPPAADGSADLAFIDQALRSLAHSLAEGCVVAMKSTVPVGSVSHFQELLRDLGSDATVVSNPEFLREGSAVDDFLHPDRIVIGTDNPAASDKLIEMYSGIAAPVVVTDPKSSEMIKYASNAYLATRITYANAIANLCEYVGADAAAVLDGMGRDQRIGPQFLRPGPGYGGSCFPKDTHALVAISDDAGYDFSLLKGVIAVNELQLHRIVDKVHAAVDDPTLLHVGMWGLAFKAGTDDVRESPAVKIAETLISDGASVSAFDPAVSQALPNGISLEESPIDAARGADVLVVATEWPEFADVDLAEVRSAMRGTTIVDARNLLDPATVMEAGFEYIGVGR